MKNQWGRTVQLFCAICCALVAACTNTYEEVEIPLDSYLLQDGLYLSAIAAEPLIEAPVDLSFDAQGRMWVLEMRGYMRTLAGTGEDDPVGRIVILEDLDQDGTADHVSVFLDSLQLARSLAHVYGGLLYAEPPNLWFVEIDEDLKPGQRTLVDPEYAVGGNVEHQANGLLMNIDNWIYNAKSTKRYRRIDGQWLVESTAFRGQWGITRDPVGRLLYNDNSTQLTGDYVLPNVVDRNRSFSSKHVISRVLVNDQRVYPLQPTPVNRGYMDGVLDPEGKLRNVTSACGPLYYQGSGLPVAYNNNAFVCVPEANLVKRNILSHQGFTLSGRQAWEGREFLVSSDIGFRPVHLKNGPDGALYIVDMHRGIIQHKTYMTSYLREKMVETGLDSLTGMGRILRISQAHDTYQPVRLNELPFDALIDALSSRNICVRDHAQQMIVASGNLALKEPLEALLDTANEVTRIHALYCLEGLGLLRDRTLDITAYQEMPWLSAHLFKLAAEGVIIPDDAGSIPIGRDSIADYYRLYYASVKGDVDAINTINDAYDRNALFHEPVLTAYQGAIDQIPDSALRSALAALRAKKIREDTQASVEYRGLTPGLQLYRTICAVCHGPDGEGLPNLAPPLLNSEFVAGDPERLTHILMYGLTGAITVAGEEYAFAAPMPGLKSNPALSDEDIRYIINYIRNAFTTSPIIPPGDLVSSVRAIDRKGSELYTVEELNMNYED